MVAGQPRTTYYCVPGDARCRRCRRARLSRPQRPFRRPDPRAAPRMPRTRPPPLCQRRRTVDTAQHMFRQPTYQPARPSRPTVRHPPRSRRRFPRYYSQAAVPLTPTKARRPRCYAARCPGTANYFDRGPGRLRPRNAGPSRSQLCRRTCLPTTADSQRFPRPNRAAEVIGFPSGSLMRQRSNRCRPRRPTTLLRPQAQPPAGPAVVQTRYERRSWGQTQPPQDRVAAVGPATMVPRPTPRRTTAAATPPGTLMYNPPAARILPAPV